MLVTNCFFKLIAASRGFTCYLHGFLVLTRLLIYHEAKLTYCRKPIFVVNIVCAKKVTPFWYPSFLPLLDALYLQFLFTFISFSLNA